MSKYKVGDKFIIEIGEKYEADMESGRASENVAVKPRYLYRIKGFNSLVFDKTGLGTLEKYVKPEPVEKPAAPILDDAERRYLRGVIRPWGNMIECIYLVKDNAFSQIIISTANGEVDLPYFSSGTMYKGMEPMRRYSLEELGIA